METTIVSQLCLDWTGDHQRDNCTAKTHGHPFGYCSIQVNGVPCGAKHNSLLHGSSSKYCNLVQVDTMSAGSASEAPGSDGETSAAVQVDTSNAGSAVEAPGSGGEAPTTVQVSATSMISAVEAPGSGGEAPTTVQVSATSMISAVEAPGSRGEVPTLDKVEAGTAGARALMQVQKITVLGNVTRAVVYWDTGSNVNLVS